MSGVGKELEEVDSPGVKRVAARHRTLVFLSHGGQDSLPELVLLHHPVKFAVDAERLAARLARKAGIVCAAPFQ